MRPRRMKVEWGMRAVRRLPAPVNPVVALVRALAGRDGPVTPATTAPEPVRALAHRSKAARKAGRR